MTASHGALPSVMSAASQLNAAFDCDLPLTIPREVAHLSSGRLCPHRLDDKRCRMV